MEIKGWLIYQVNKTPVLCSAESGEKVDWVMEKGSLVVDFGSLISSWGVDGSCCRSYLIKYSFLFLLVFLLPLVKGVLQVRFQGRIWLFWDLLSMTRQFVRLGVSIMLGMRVSSSEWRTGWMLSGCNRVDQAGDSQHLCFSLPHSHFLSFSRPRGFPAGTSGKETTCKCRRHKRPGFNPWVGKIPWRRTWQPTPVFLPGESHGQRRLVGYSP